MNPMTYIDFYKADHRRQYTPGTEEVYSNWTPRGSRVPGQDQIVFLGLQYFLKNYLMGHFQKGFFDLPEDEVCEKYAKRMNSSLGPNTIGTDHIRALHRLGYLPLEFRAIPEGSITPLRIPQFTVKNTLPEFFWLTNYFETLLSTTVWLPCTSATQASYLRRILEKGAKTTGSPMEFIDWQAHDFSFRGMGGLEAACLSGMGHLVFFTGTDTIPAIDLIEEYYGPLPDNYLIGGSVAATEHSVACAWIASEGGTDIAKGEFKYLEHLLNLYPNGIVSAVSDTFDLWRLITDYLPRLKDKIIAREGKLVIRPDSGDPVKIICGDDSADPGSPQEKGVIQLLWEVFGGTTNVAGLKVLDSHIGCIYGDAINKDRMQQIINLLAQKGFASCNMVFGVGSYTYQFATRDTYGNAMKATHAVVNGKEYDLYKKPVTDDGTKFSAIGRLSVLKENGEYYLKNQATKEEEDMSLLKPVWRDGKFLQQWTFDQVRAQAKKDLDFLTNKK